MGGSRWGLLLLSAVVLLSLGTLRHVEAAVTNDPLSNLQLHYYQNSCPGAEENVTQQVEFYWNQDKSLAPKLIRMLYSDCFITGCDASILLDGPNSEKTAPQNAGLLGFPMTVIDEIKQLLEQRCPGVVSCADILTLAVRDAVLLAGGPAYPVPTGRRDGISSLASSVDLPLQAVPWKSVALYFQSKGLDATDLTTLLGAHSMGKTSCKFIADRLYNFNNTGNPDPSIDPSFLAQMRTQCPPNSTNQVYLDPDTGSSYNFSKAFYARVMNHQAVLGIDQQITNQNDSLRLAQEYNANFEDFQNRFALSISRLGTIKVLTGNQGEVRKNCRVVNGS